jgi:ribosomal protein S18 acetylase RimI-like enzyme
LKPKDVIIREFRMDDYENVLRLWDEGGISYRPKGRESRQHIEKELKSNQAIFLVAEGEGIIVGVVLGTHDGRKGWINRLAIAKDSRRQNIARKLVTAVETRLNEMGIDVIACLIEDENTLSVKFFEKLGYTKGTVEYFSKRKSWDS